MNRRNFIAGLMAAAGGMALDPERLLWTPGQTLISIPKPGILTGFANNASLGKSIMQHSGWLDDPMMMRYTYRIPFKRIIAVPKSGKP